MAFITTNAPLTRVLPTTRRPHGRVTCSANNERRALPPADTSGRSPTAQPANFGFVGGTKLGISFTCTVNNCNTRISKMIRRSTYEHGTVLIQCPTCKTKHIIADHYGWYTDVSNNLTNIERIAEAKGQKVVRVTSDVFNLEKLVSTQQQESSSEE